MDEAQVDWGNAVPAKPTYEELEKRIHALEKEIKDNKRRTEKLLKSDQLLSQILQGTFIPTFVIDSRHIVTHWNRALEGLTGLSAAEMIGTRNHWRLLYTSERPLMADLVVEDASEDTITRYYDVNCRKSTIIEAAYEVENYFPELERWLFFTAAPLVDGNGGIIGAIETLQDITAQKKAEEELRQSEQRYREMSITDSLTKLYNSRHFFRQLAYEVERAKRYKNPLSLILLDIDNFKGYNDTYGHLEGDKALRALSDVIRKKLRACDSAYRCGGEEFTVLLPETEGEKAFVAAERLRKDVENEILTPLPGTEAHMTVSIGVSRYIPDEQPSTFLERVDEGMYKAKKLGKKPCFPGSKHALITMEVLI
jgi:diguanylate cyclase (GGDEF)-like protein/PAS domain S-box-containing protein